MKNEELKNLKQMTIEALAKELKTTKEKLFDLNKKLALDKLKNTADIKKTKIKIARINTLITQKMLEELANENRKEKNEK